MRIYDMEQNATDRDILVNMFNPLSMLDIILNECNMYQYKKPVHKADR